ncbi:hypothetical protein N566_06975 [Streptomycetaceae bacterium MP113-05]|nr:hypothetical protein N566_06975 [Streptomycetaceae bacterium MP113-05]
MYGGGWLIAAAWAAGFPLISTPEPHRLWGISAGFGYLCAAIAAFWPSRLGARSFPVALALTGAVVLPLLYFVLTGSGQSEVGVIERSGMLTAQQGTPYLADPRTVGEVTPYLPGMALFGLPRAVLGEEVWLLRLLGDARIWCAAAFLACLWGGHKVMRRSAAREPGRAERDYPYGLVVAVLIASPVVAMPLCVSGVDLPLVGLFCLALAFASRGLPVPAGLALAAACSLKWTALPAVAVAVCLLACVAGRRAAVRCAGATLAGAVTLVLPSVLLSPGPMVQQVLAFPTGRGEFQTPAGSPLPGKLLADLGPVGWCAAVTLLLAGGLAVAVSLVVRPPYDLVSAADRLAVGLCLAFLLAPAGRFGYLALPVVLVVWARLASGSRRSALGGSRLVRSSVPAKPIPAGAAR